jgi:CDGSH-type Zn-finger protein
VISENCRSRAQDTCEWNVSIHRDRTFAEGTHSRAQDTCEWNVSIYRDRTFAEGTHSRAQDTCEWNVSIYRDRTLEERHHGPAHAMMSLDVQRRLTTSLIPFLSVCSLRGSAGNTGDELKTLGLLTPSVFKALVSLFCCAACTVNESVRE